MTKTQPCTPAGGKDFNYFKGFLLIVALRRMSSRFCFDHTQTAHDCLLLDFTVREMGGDDQDQGLDSFAGVVCAFYSFL